MMLRRVGVLLAAALMVFACDEPQHQPPTPTPPRATVVASPTAAGTFRPDHVVVVILENKAYQQVAGIAPYLTGLMDQAAVFTESYAITHPSQPNYLALFSGSTHGVTDDHCPVDLVGQPNLAQQLIDSGFSFAGYSEDLPKAGFLGCSSGRYAAKHNPWADFDNVPASANQPFSAFPSDYAHLPTVSFVVPNLCHDMHDCSVLTGDNWVRDHLDGYLRWAHDHHSLLVVTFDEDNDTPVNKIFTLIAGTDVRPGRYSQHINHYTVLRTIEDLYGLPPLVDAAPITGIWRG